MEVQDDFKSAINRISYEIVGCAIEVHRTFGGPGLLESIYEEALAIEMSQKGLIVDRQRVVSVVYKQKRLAGQLRLDLVVNNLIVVECKATLEHQKIYEAQLYTYLKVSQMSLGLLLNFGATTMRHGVRRVVNAF